MLEADNLTLLKFVFFRPLEEKLNIACREVEKCLFTLPVDSTHKTKGL